MATKIHQQSARAVEATSAGERSYARHLQRPSHQTTGRMQPWIGDRSSVPRLFLTGFVCRWWAELAACIDRSTRPTTHGSLSLPSHRATRSEDEGGA